MGDAAAAAAAAPHAAVVSPVDRVDAQVGSDLSGPDACLRQGVDPGSNGVSADIHTRDVRRKGRVEDDGLSYSGVGDGEQEERESIDLEWRHVRFFGRLGKGGGGWIWWMWVAPGEAGSGKWWELCFCERTHGINWG